MATEADTCRKFVVPKLQAAGWDDDPHSIAEQRWFTKGRIVVCGNHADRRKGKLTFNILDYTGAAIRNVSAWQRPAAALPIILRAGECFGIPTAEFRNAIARSPHSPEWLQGVERLVEQIRGGLETAEEEALKR